MCGIAGFVDLAGKYDRAEKLAIAKAMSDRIVYRGPDDAGLWIDPGENYVLAHRRLSIIDTSAAGHQPMESSDGLSCIAFNGEIYNYQELRPDLEQRGYEFRTRTDTEVLIACLREYGEAAFSKLDAMYAFAFFHGPDSRLTLARDPFGKKPLYYASGDGWFAFASELHALTCVPEFDTTIEHETLAEYFSFQYIGAPRTIYRGAKKLPPGHFLHLDHDGSIGIGRHFAFEPCGDVAATAPLAALADELEEILLRCTKRRMISDVPLGAFLSGGVDSATVVALMTKALGGQVKTFSIGFDGTKETEHLLAREMAEHLGTAHHDKVLKPDVLSLAKHIATVLDEPNADSSCLPTYLLSGFAREHVTVALSGDGGDEMFGGYGRYFSTLEEDANGQLGDHPGDVYYSDRILVYPDRHIVELFGEVPPRLLAHLKRLRSFVSRGPGPLLRRMRKTDADNYMPGAVLAKVDRMSMQHSLEVRSPLLSIEVARFAAGVGVDSLYRAGQGKLVLKELAARYIPRAWLERPKMGFGMPMDAWGRKQTLLILREHVLGGDAQIGKWIEPERMQAFLHRQEKVGFSLYQVWAMLILENWLRAHECEPAVIERPVVINGRRIPAGRTLCDLQSPLAEPEDHVLLGHLDELDQPVTLFCLDSIPPWWRAVAKRLTVAFPVAATPSLGAEVVQFDWTAPHAQELPETLEPGVAVFPASDIQVPTWLLGALGQAGYSEAVILNRTGWVPITLAEPVPMDLPEDDDLHRIRLVSRPWRRFAHNGGMCWQTNARKVRRLVDGPDGPRAEFALYEDGARLPFPESPHVDIRLYGAGRYSLWENSIFFSASDGSDPNTNGRRYEAVVRPLKQRPGAGAVLRPRITSDEEHLAAFRDAVSAEQESVDFGDRKLRVGLVIGSLSPGGAERQLCNLANGLAERGHEVKILAICGVDGTSNHYLNLLKHDTIEMVSCTTPHPDYDFSPPTGGPGSIRADLLASLPSDVKVYAWRLYTHMHMLDLDVAHCFLDQPNLLGAIAAWLADVPRILMSARNVNPTNFPYIDLPWYHPWYQVFENSPRLRFSGNSRIGCDDYARWLGWPEGTFTVIRNGIDPTSLGGRHEDAVSEFREGEGMTPDTPMILGVFRLSDEKRPLLFLDVVARVREQVPDLRVFVAGIGARQPEMLERIKKLRLGDSVHLLGRRRDVPVLMQAASLLLLTSDNEGTPNVTLEAQWFERPVVCCRVGGCPEAVLHRETGLVYATDDIDGIIAGCVELLRDPELRARYGAAGKTHVATHFSLEQMVEASLALYYSPRPAVVTR